MPTFTALKARDEKNVPPKWAVVICEDQDVMVTGDKGIALVANGTAAFPLSLPGELFDRQKGGKGWQHPDDRQQRRGGGGFQRDPLAELVGISHSQVMTAILETRPPDVKLVVFWREMRSYIKQMALEVAADRLEMKKELGGHG